MANAIFLQTLAVPAAQAAKVAGQRAVHQALVAVVTKEAASAAVSVVATGNQVAIVVAVVTVQADKVETVRVDKVETVRVAQVRDNN
jgi:hypothetical protein